MTDITTNMSRSLNGAEIRSLGSWLENCITSETALLNTFPVNINVIARMMQARKDDQGDLFFSFLFDNSSDQAHYVLKWCSEA